MVVRVSARYGRGVRIEVELVGMIEHFLEYDCIRRVTRIEMCSVARTAQSER
jgi:hypothetical protein